MRDKRSLVIDNTRYLLHYPVPALKKVALLLAAYRDPEKDLTIRLGSPVTPEWNPVSNYVFLIDQNFNVAIIDESGALRDWWVCQCGREGFSEAMIAGGQCCRAVIEQWRN